MNQELLEELTILFALGELSPSETEIIQNYVEPKEQKALLETINALGYSAPLIETSPKLKAKIWQRLEQESPRFLPKRYQNLQWEPHPVVKGIELALLHIDTQQRQAAYLVNCQPNVEYPAHQHRGTESLLILDGHIVIEGEVYGKGDFLLSLPESVHAPSVPDGCLFYVHTSLDDQFVEWTPAMVWQFIKYAFGRLQPF